MTSRLLTVREAATMLGRTTGFVRALISEGMVHGVKVRGRWYVTDEALTGWLSSGAPDPVMDIVVMPEIVMPKRHRGAA